MAATLEAQAATVVAKSANFMFKSERERVKYE
jgi:hypothetical protein